MPGRSCSQGSVFFSIRLARFGESLLNLPWTHAWEASGAALFEARSHFELTTVAGLSILTGQFFYRAYNNASREHLPVTFLAALVMLVLGTQQTAMSIRREKLRLVYGLPSVHEKLRLQVAYSTLAVLLLIAAWVLLAILKSHLE